MSPDPTLFDQPLIAMPRAELRARAEAAPGEWAEVVVHLCDVIDGYTRALDRLDRPASNGTDTSDHAARTLAPSIRGRRARILLSMVWHDSDPNLEPDDLGMTCHDLERRLYWNHGSCSARVHELAKLGYIIDTGRRRVTSRAGDGREFKAAVYEVTDLGRDALQQFDHDHQQKEDHHES